jgi:hypothetical protein
MNIINQSVIGCEVDIHYAERPGGSTVWGDAHWRRANVYCVDGASWWQMMRMIHQQKVTPADRI